MSPDSLASPPKECSSNIAGFAQWLVIGAAGVALVFVIAVEVPQRFKKPVLFFVGLESVAAWGLGRWGAARGIPPTKRFAIAVAAILAASSVLMSIKTHRDGVKAMRAQKQWQASTGDPISENFKQFLLTVPEGETEQERARRLEMLADVERGEAMRRERLEYLTFSGYLSSRVPKEWGKWNPPWPAVFWGAEILLGSTLGAWIALWTLRSQSPLQTHATTSSNPTAASRSSE